MKHTHSPTAITLLTTLLALSSTIRPTVAAGPFRKPHREPSMVEDGMLWIDAEDFKDYGGWTLDTQFVHLMGSAYLMATGVGTPVRDAVTTLTLKKADTFRVWVRARNWVRTHAPGRFQLAIDGKTLPKTFGMANSDGWVWEDGGRLTLTAGTHALALHDLTGFYGRCDAIVLARDAAYRPPAAVPALTRERSRLTGLLLEPRDAGHYDVIVVGAGSAGCPAALAAARSGAHTALIQNRPVLGGNCSRECGVPLNGAGSHNARARETGIPEEVGRVKAHHGYRYYGDAFEHLTDRQNNLSVFLNQHVYTVAMKDPATVAGVTAVDTMTGRIHRYTGTVFIDCTGDGWVGHYAGADYRLGRESVEEHDEPLAQHTADRITMSGCLMGGYLAFRAVDTKKPAPYRAPAWAYQLPPHAEFGRRIRRVTGGEWWLEHPGTIDDIWNAEFARDELIRITYGYWDHVKHQSELKDKARTYALDAVPIMDAKRESRRLLGDHILTQQDVQSGRVFDDRVSYGGWSIDVHHPEGILSGKQGPYHFDPHVPIYTIPYRCLYSRNIGNLLFAGRCASVTHVALGTVRVQSTLSTLGQAAGTAAGLCIAHNTSPRGIHQHHLRELQQQLLKDDQTIPELTNQDPHDLARTATATATSTSGFTEFTRLHVKTHDMHPLNMRRGMVVQPSTNQQFDSLFVCLESTRDEPLPITLTLGKTDNVDDVWKDTTGTATVTAIVPPGQRNWVAFPLETKADREFFWFYLPPTEGVSWLLMRMGPSGAHRAYGSSSGHWTDVPGQHYAFHTVPALRTINDYAAANVLNGRKRDWRGRSNMWMSDIATPLPQAVTLKFPKPTAANAIHVTFDTNLGPSRHIDASPPTCVRDYTLTYHDGNAWQELVTEAGNFQRHRIHRFDTVTMKQLRLTVTATNGDPAARVFEIRVYNE